MRVYPLLIVLLCAGCATAPTERRVDIERLDNPWYQDAQADLASALGRDDGGTRARNVILFIGDGMSVATVTAARILEGQLRNETGEENLLSFERFGYTGLAKTYNTNAQVPDSAGTATAMMSGVKTKISVVGVGGDVIYDDCASAATHSVPSMLEHAERAGLSTGVITTTRITHATPASAYAHVPNREWESRTEQEDENCIDIARQMIEFDVGDGPEVLLGGGRAPFMPETSNDPEDADTTGWRQDGRDLIAEWQARNGAGQYVWNRAQFDAVDARSTNKLLGLFERSHMQYEADRNGGPDGEPSIADMVDKAVQILGRSDDGFFLLVEGGRIDHAHHGANAYRALLDTIAFSDAIGRARAMTSADDTLIIVTADHGHVMEIAGYPKRGNPILGKVVSPRATDPTDYSTDINGRPYTTLVYGNGPGHVGATDTQAAGAKRYRHGFEKHLDEATTRPDLTDVDTTGPNYLQEAAVPMGSETHSGADVPIYADGPGARLLTGVHEQNYIFHVMLHALFGN